RPHGETGAIVDMLTASRGRWVAHVAGGASRRIKPVLQAGAPGLGSYKGPTPHPPGPAAPGGRGAGPPPPFHHPPARAGGSPAPAVPAAAVRGREPHPGAFLAFEALAGALSLAEIWPAVYVRFEAGLLEELGFGLDLSRCAATGSTEDLIYVSPRTG